jgi:hypothetical protein
LRGSLDNARNFFICNTNRGREEPPDLLEEKMHKRNYAAAWGEFAFPDHMRKVSVGDVILMYANRAGIIGIGRAESGQPEILQPGAPDRIRTHKEKGANRREWRIPVTWLIWVEDHQACAWPSRVQTFLDVTGGVHRERLETVKRHFLGLHASDSG